MRFYTHAAFGIFLFVIASKFVSIEITLFAVLFLVLGTLLPDIDETRSYIGRRAKPLSTLIKLLNKHRGLTHSLVFALLVYIALYGTFGINSIPFSLGYLSHLAGDAMTTEGLAVFYPYSKKKVRGYIKTGGIVENVVFVGIIVSIILLY